eukprot:5260296-Prymnesium_polylepis.1
MATQANESANAVRVVVHPKRLCLAKSDGDVARQGLGVARFNDGFAASTAAVLEQMGIVAGDLRALTAIDGRRAKRK